MVVAIVATVFAGFAPTYYLRPSDAPPLMALTRIHGLVFTAWVLLFGLQVWLVESGRRETHRRLGLAGAALALAMIVLGYLVAIAAARRDAATGNPDEALGFLIIPLGDLLAFTVIVGAGLWRRGTPDLHRRLMLLATLALLPAAIGRIPGFDSPALFVPYFLALLMAQPAHDWWTRGRPHPLSVWVGLAVLASELARFFSQQTPWWRAIADWLVSR